MCYVVSCRHSRDGCRTSLLIAGDFVVLHTLGHAKYMVSFSHTTQIETDTEGRSLFICCENLFDKPENTHTFFRICRNEHTNIQTQKVHKMSATSYCRPL